MERLAAPAPVWSAPLKVPPVAAASGPMARLLSDLLAGATQEEVPLAEGEVPFRQEVGLSPLWAPAVFLEEDPSVAADAYSLAGAEWAAGPEGRHLDLTI